jgi:signal transduction histidine kinase
LRLPTLLQRLREPASLLVPYSPVERHQIERLLAASRVALGAGALIAINVDRAEPVRFAALAHASLLAYLLGAVGVYMLLGSSAPSRWCAHLLHGIDVAYLVLLRLFTSDANSLFFLLFLFVMLGAAYRWGLRSTIATAVGVVALVVGEALVLAPYPRPGGDTEVNQLILWGSYMLIGGVVVGALSEQAHQLRARAMLTGRVVIAARAGQGFAATVARVSQAVLDAFDMAELEAVVCEASTGRVFSWRIRRLASPGRPAVELAQLDPASPEARGNTMPQAVDALQFDGLHTPRLVLALDADGSPVAGTPIPGAVASYRPEPAQVWLRVTGGTAWSGRVVLVADRRHRLDEDRLRMLQGVCRAAVSALHGVYRTGLKQARAGAAERARVGRRLHDGVVQSLYASQLQLEVLRRRALGGDASVSEPLGALERRLREDARSIRDLMHELGPPAPGAGRIVKLLGTQVDRCARRSGLEIGLVTDERDIVLSSRLCREILRIVREALLKLHPDSGATRALVHFATGERHWRLIVEDNGHGCERERVGPMVMRERVRALGGTLVIGSEPGTGTRLEVQVPFDTVVSPMPGEGRAGRV